jgi:Flp pilus assembly protein TadD
MRERGKLEAARVEYGKAMKLVGARVPVLTGRFAGVAMRTGREAEAEQALAEALDSHPDYPALHIGLGRLYVRKKAWDPAREHFLLANRIDPFDPEIHAGLALAYEGLGDAGSASREKRFAQLLAGAGGAPGSGGPGAAPAPHGGPLHGGGPAQGGAPPASPHGAR